MPDFKQWATDYERFGYIGNLVKFGRRCPTRSYAAIRRAESAQMVRTQDYDEAADRNVAAIEDVERPPSTVAQFLLMNPE